MASRKQAEIPGTRRDDEPPPPKTIKALDDACEELERRKGKAGIVRYPYEDLKGVERYVFVKNSIATAKAKKDKVDPDTSDDDEGAGE